jgi:hypothetical protein
MIYIDFQGGSHGNYLEFVCNKFLAKIITVGLPFNELGASHSKNYQEDKVFKAWHYFEYRGQRTELYNSKIISIQIEPADLLPLASVSLLRAGNYNLDNDQLEIDTYNKLSNLDYGSVLENIIQSFFQTQVHDSYQAVRDPSWPDVNNIQDFKNLPAWIKQECLEQHNLQLLELSPQHPDCPRHILREFFKIGFKYPDQSGFITTQQHKMYYDNTNDVVVFPYRAFYDLQAFQNQIKCIASWGKFDFDVNDEFIKLHEEFLKRQIYQNSKIYCDNLIQQIINDNEFFDLPKLDLLQESYIIAQLELYYGRNLPVELIDWLDTSNEIREWFK